jgi:hypothetical protein
MLESILPKVFTDYTEEDYNLVMNTNVASFLYMTQLGNNATAAEPDSDIDPSKMRDSSPAA